MAQPDTFTLADLPIGRSATVTKLSCERRIACRLMEMGLLPGTRVEMVRVAPLGDPIEVRLRGYSLSLRRQEAANLELAPAATTIAVSPATEALPQP